MLKIFNITSCKLRLISLSVKILFSLSNKQETNKKKEEMKKISYQKTLGSLI